MKIEQLSKGFKVLVLFATMNVGVAFAYFVVAKLGLYLATINAYASPVWPATGLALSCILFFGSKVAPGIFVGAFFANLLTGLPILAALFIGFGNSLEALVGVWLFRYVEVETRRLGIHAKVINYVLVAMIPTAISATVGTLTLLNIHTVNSGNFKFTWLTWWLGDVLGALILLPLAVKIQNAKVELRCPSLKVAAQVVAVLLTASALCYCVFDLPSGAPFLFILFLGLLTAALWLSSWWIYLVSIFICVYSTIKTTEKLGPFNGGIINENLIHLQLFLAGVGLTAIVLATMRKEGFKRSALVALVFGWSLTGSIFYSFFQESIHRDAELFNSAVADSEKIISEKFSSYTRLLEVGAGLFEVSNSISRAEWTAFTGHLDFEKQYPGIEGLGVGFVVRTKSDEKALIEDQRRGGFKNFQIRPVKNAPEDFVVHRAPFKVILTYMAPQAKNELAIGIDVMTEVHRSEGMKKAGDLGVVTITDQVTLVQDQKARPGFVIFMPFYKRNMSLETVDQRRQAFRGMVAAPIVIEKFITTALDFPSKGIHLKMYFGPKDKQNEVFSSSAEKSVRGSVKESSILMAGMPVTLVWSRSKGFPSQSSLVASWAGFSGALISIILGILLTGLENLTDRAQRIADEKTSELSKRESMWRALTEASPIGIYIVDGNGMCTYINDTFAKIIGFDLNEIKCRGWQDLIHPEDKMRVAAEWKRYIGIDSVFESNFECNFRFMIQNREVHVSSQAVAIKNELNQVTGHMGTMQDITERYNNQMALVTSSRLSSLGEMAGGVAHEINNPLTIISGNAQQLLSSVQSMNLDPEKVQFHAYRIRANVERIAKIIKGLRSIARDVPSDPPKEVDPSEVIQDTLELCRSRFNSHDVELQVLSLVDEEVKFSGHSEQIVQVLLNLLNNAFDAVQNLEERWVKVEVRRKLEKIQFCVTDSGPGLSKHLQEKIFSPFFTTKDVGKGTGLGLSISKGLIERHKGCLYLDQHSLNTKFIFELTIARPHAEKDLSC